MPKEKRHLVKQVPALSFRKTGTDFMSKLKKKAPMEHQAIEKMRRIGDEELMASFPERAKFLRHVPIHAHTKAISLSGIGCLPMYTTPYPHVK